MKEIYLDNAATTKPYEDVVDVANNVLEEMYFNPSAIYSRAVDLSKRVNDVRKNILNALNAQEGNLIFTSGGTESTNTVFNNLLSSKRKKIIITEYEHSATTNSAIALEKYGFSIVKVRVKNTQMVLDNIIDEIDDNTALVSVMHVNNEVGNIIDIETLGKKIKQKNINTYFHVDAVQSFMKLKIDVEKSKVDYLSISAHKIHGIKGSGALYIRNTNKFKPLILGGGQEFGMRSGTDNTLGVLTFGKAVEIGLKNFELNSKKVKDLRERFISGILEIDNSFINSNSDGASHILNVSFLGVPSEILLHDLESKGIYISSGSACSSKKKTSKTLDALGLEDELKKSAIRVSFSPLNTLEEIDFVCKEIVDSVNSIRKIVKYKR